VASPLWWRPRPRPDRLHPIHYPGVPGRDPAAATVRGAPCHPVNPFIPNPSRVRAASPTRPSSAQHPRTSAQRFILSRPGIPPKWAISPHTAPAIATPTPPTTSQAYTVPDSTGRATVESTRADSIQTFTKEPTVTPELIGILATGGTLAGLMLALWRDTRADIQNLRAEVRADFGDLRKDVQSLTERTSRLEGVIEGVFAGRDRRNDAA